MIEAKIVRILVRLEDECIRHKDHCTLNSQGIRIRREHIYEYLHPDEYDLLDSYRLVERGGRHRKQYVFPTLEQYLDMIKGGIRWEKIRATV